MFIRETMYYFMSNKQLSKEIMKIRRKLEAEENIEKRLKYFNALADILKALIRKYRNDDEFMEYVTVELNKLRTQIKEAL